MKVKVFLTPEADRDLEDEFNYLTERNIDAASRFLKAMEETLEILADAPEIGSPRQFKKPQLIGVRMWPIKSFPNYLIFYLQREEHLQVLRILHGAQDIERIFSNI